MRLDRIKVLLLTGLGTGRMPVAPGTWGSALAAILWLALRAALWPSGPGGGIWLDAATGAGIVAAAAVCVGWGRWIIRRTGRADPNLVTIDEFAGQWLALLFMPSVTSPVLVAGVQLALFRLFDITKPPPCRQLERLPAGWGILADDLMAGLYANLAGQIGFYFLYWVSI